MMINGLDYGQAHDLPPENESRKIDENHTI